jgi:hypothetical protein
MQDMSALLAQYGRWLVFANDCWMVNVKGEHECLHKW